VDIDRLFVHTLRDLEERTDSTNEYTVLMSAALLRKLLLDESRLADQVNRNHRLKLRYRISGVSPYEKLMVDASPVFWAIEDALDPDSPIAYAPYDATRDQFLARQVMYFGGNRITVRDVIDQLANVEGGVHSGSPKDDRQKALQAAAEFYNRSGLPGAVRVPGCAESQGQRHCTATFPAWHDGVPCLVWIRFGRWPFSRPTRYSPPLTYWTTLLSAAFASRAAMTLLTLRSSVLTGHSGRGSRSRPAGRNSRGQRDARMRAGSSRVAR
jgi:hypothetical protein